MNCLYCGEKLGLFARRFCNAKHQELWRQRESDLAIQRLKDPFGTGGSPVTKQPLPARPAPDSPNALIVTRAGKIEPPQVRELAEDRPASQFDPPNAVQEPVALSGNTSDQSTAASLSGNASGERTAPPLAGFISLFELKALSRLPVFTRRPEPGNRSAGEPGNLDPRFIDQILARRSFDERRVETGFTPSLCISPIHPCEPERHAGRLFVGLPDEKLFCTFPMPPRKPEFQACKAPTTALQTPTFVPHPKESEVRVYGISSALDDARPIAMSRRDVEHKSVVARYPDIVRASLPHVAGPQPQAARSASAPRALGTTIGRVRPALPNSAFQVLPVLQNATVVGAGAATAPGMADRKVLGTALPVDPRMLQLHARKLPIAAFQTAAFAPHPKESEPRVYAVSGARSNVLPIAMARRAMGRRPMVARYPEIVQASLPPTAGSQSQAACDATAPQLPGAATGRFKPAPIAMARRAVQRKPWVARYPETVQTSLPHVARPQPQAHYSQASTLGAVISQPAPITMARRAVQRTPLVATYPETVQTSLPHVARPQPQTHYSQASTLGAVISQPAPIAMARRAVQRQPLVARYPETVLASLPHVDRSQPQVRDSQASRAFGAAIGWVTPAPIAMARRAVQRQPLVARYPETVPASLLHVDRRQPQAAYRVTAPLALGVAIRRVIPALPNSAFDALPILQTRPAWPVSAAAQGADLPDPERLCTTLRIEPGKLEFHTCELPRTALHAAVFAPPPKKSEPTVYSASRPVSLVRQMALSRRARERKPVVARYPEFIQAGLPHLAGPQPQATRSAKALRARAAAIGRVTPALPNSAFQALPVLQDAPDASARGATAPCANLPHRKLLSTAFRVEPRRLDSRAWKVGSAFQTPAFAPRREESKPKLYALSDATYDARPIAVSRRAAELQRAVAKYPETVQAILSRRAGPQPQAAGYAAAQRTLGTSIGRLRPALSNSAFLLPIWQSATVMPARAAAQLADLPDRKLLCTALRVEPRGLDSKAWKMPTAALHTPAFAPHPKISEQSVYGVSDAAYDMRPIALPRRAVERKSALAPYPEMLQVTLPHITVPQAQAGRGVKIPRPLGAAAIRRVRPTPPESAFQALPIGFNASFAPMTAATATSHPTADMAISTYPRHSEFATVASIWDGPSGLPGTSIISGKPEFVLESSDHIIACPSRPGPSRDSKPPSFQRFVPWSQSLRQPVHQASFLNLQTSVDAASGGANAAAGLAHIAGWTRARQAPDRSAPILQLPRRMSDPVQLPSAVPRRHSAVAQGEWSVGGVSVLEEQLLPDAAEPDDAVELTLASIEALGKLGKATAANSGLKWVPLKVPWIPMP